MKRGHVFAHARGPKRPGQMNKLEAEYAWRLRAMEQEGAILHWAYEPMKLRLADKTFLTPDFFVIAADGEAQFHEVKGPWMEEDANVKLKVAAEIHPFRFLLVRQQKASSGGGWEIAEVGNAP